MPKQLHVRELNWLQRLADILMTPIMFFVAGTIEGAQQTHRWNNTKLKTQDVKYLNPELMVRCQGIPTSAKRKIFGIPLFHIPIFGGWRNYVVLRPEDECVDGWHVGWIAGDVAGVSRIKLEDLVRTLIGPGDVTFFGVATSGDQISLKQVATGQIGDGGPYRKVPLL